MRWYQPPPRDSRGWEKAPHKLSGDSPIHPITAFSVVFPHTPEAWCSGGEEMAGDGAVGTLGFPTRGPATGRQASVPPARESLGGLRPLLASWVGEAGVSVGWQLNEGLEDAAWLPGVSGAPSPRWLAGQGRGWRVTWRSRARGDVASTELWPGHPERLHLDFGSAVPLRTRVTRQLILTNCSPIQTPFTLKFEYFGSPANSLRQKPSR